MVGGLSALGAGLYSVGIPKDSILLYETAVKNGCGGPDRQEGDGRGIRKSAHLNPIFMLL